MHLYLRWPVKAEAFSEPCTEHWQAADYKEMGTFSIILDATVKIKCINYDNSGKLRNCKLSHLYLCVLTKGYCELEIK